MWREIFSHISYGSFTKIFDRRWKNFLIPHFSSLRHCLPALQYPQTIHTDIRCLQFDSLCLHCKIFASSNANHSERFVTGSGKFLQAHNSRPCEDVYQPCHSTTHWPLTLEVQHLAGDEYLAKLFPHLAWIIRWDFREKVEKFLHSAILDI